MTLLLTVCMWAGARYACGSRGVPQRLGCLYGHRRCRRRPGDLHTPVRTLFKRSISSIANIRPCRFQLVTGRTWRGSAFGGVKGRTELPTLVEGILILFDSSPLWVFRLNYLCIDYLAGKVKVDEYVTHHRKFDEINAGFHDMHVRLLIFI